MNRIDRLRQVMDSQSESCFLIFNQFNITYLTGFNGHAATLLITPSENYLITDYRYLEQARSQVENITVICRDRVVQSLGSLINDLLNKDEVNETAFEADHISFSLWHEMKSQLDIKQTKPVSGLVENLRYIKDQNEIASIASAASIADQALLNILPLIKPGVTEHELATELDYQMSKLGSEEVSFATILLFGPRCALPHGIPGNNPLKEGDFILLDFGAVIDGYHSDMTRTYIHGKPSNRQKEVFNLVRDAQQAVLDSIEEGVTGEYLNQQSENVIMASPYAEYMGKGLGHGVGLEVHELPFMNRDCPLIIENGCVITVEPGIYIPDWGGVRIEDDVVLTDGGLKILNSSAKELLEL